jgi:RHS repeat-associated protein
MHPEHLNTPRLIADTTGTPVWKWDQTEPFGVNSPDENPSAQGAFEFPLRFPGQYADKETTQHYNYFRDYDPSLGRYGESDLIGLTGGLNTYAYVRGRPTTHSDPLGLDWFKPPSAPSSVGRQGSIVEPGGPVSSVIENCVPAGYEFGILHDQFVDDAVGAGWPDAIVNIPSMPYFYMRAVATESLVSTEEAVGRLRAYFRSKCDPIRCPPNSGRRRF